MKDGWHLGPGAGTILGIEVLLPNSMGRIWLEGAEGLHLLYGRNGSGKSTVLNALRSFFMGQSTSETVRCFMRLPDSILEGPTRLADVEQDAADLLRTIIESDQFSLLADEPTGNLDQETAADVQSLLFELNQEHGTRLVLATHDLDLAHRTEQVFELRNGILSLLKG